MKGSEVVRWRRMKGMAGLVDRFGIEDASETEIEIFAFGAFVSRTVDGLYRKKWIVSRYFSHKEKGGVGR